MSNARATRSSGQAPVAGPSHPPNIKPASTDRVERASDSPTSRLGSDEDGAPTVAGLSADGADALALARRPNPAGVMAIGGADQGLSKATTKNVPAFLLKLYTMVNDPATSHLIHWSDAGDSFIVLSADRIGRELLPRFFKHSNFGSFVRQLNMYGFHKVPHLNQGVLQGNVAENEILEFRNQDFRRGQPDLLCLIQRKKSEAATAVPQPSTTGTAGAPGRPPGGPSPLDWNKLLSDLSAIRKHQTAVSEELKKLQASNRLLWQETVDSRDRHKKSQETINKILGFLAQVFGGRVLEEGTPAEAHEAEEEDVGSADLDPSLRSTSRPTKTSPLVPRLPRLLLEDVARDERPRRTATHSAAKTRRSQTDVAGTKGKGRVEELDSDDSRFSEAATPDDNPRFSTLTDSPPSPDPAALSKSPSVGPQKARPKGDTRESSTSIKPQGTSSASTAPTPSVQSVQSPALDPDMVAQLANDPMLAAILSGVNRTPQPYSISWPDTSANNYFPANAPIHAGSGANTAGLPPPIQSPSRFPSLPDATLTNAGSSTDANGLPLTPYRRMSKDTAAISQNVDALQAAIEQLVKNLPPEAQAQVLNSAGAYNGNNGDGNNGVGTDGIDWSSVLGGATGTQQAPDANLGDYFNTDAFLQNYGEDGQQDQNGVGAWPTNGSGTNGTSDGFPNSATTADQGMTPISSLFANLPSAPTETADADPSAAPVEGGMDDFDRLWADSPDRNQTAGLPDEPPKNAASSPSTGKKRAAEDTDASTEHAKKVKV